MSSKSLRRILIFFIILNIMVTIFIIRVINEDNDPIQNKQLQGKIKESKEEKQRKFKNIDVLYRNYRGEIPKAEIAGKIERIALQYFPIVLEQITDNNISPEEYFEKNKASIKNRFGITEEEKFSILIKKLKELNCNIRECKTYELLENSFTNDDIYTKCTLVYTYSNNQEIKLDFYINNSNSDSRIEYKINP